jgi:hypothetical protein
MDRSYSRLLQKRYKYAVNPPQGAVSGLDSRRHSVANWHQDFAVLAGVFPIVTRQSKGTFRLGSNALYAMWPSLASPGGQGRE